MNFKFLLFILLLVPIASATTTVTTNITSIADSQVLSNFPATNYGTESTVSVSSGPNTYKGLIKFDLSSLPSNANITNASISYYVAYRTGTVGLQQLYRITATWTETGVIYNNMPAYVTDYEVTSPITINYWNVFSNASLLSLVKGWHNNTVSNYGVYVFLNNSDVVAFASKENTSYAPKLTVTYNINITLSGTVTELETSNAIAGARVNIYKSDYSWSDEVKTDSNGFYSFNDLTFDTYYLSVTKTGEYANSPIYYVTMNGSSSARNMIMEKCVSSQDCYFNSHYVVFKFINEWGTSIQGINVSVYETTSSNAIYSSMTNLTDGAVNFLLKKDTYYRITFNKSSLSYDDEIYIIPSETEYQRIVWGATSGDRAGTVSYDLTVVSINSTNSSLNFTYSDSGSDTTAINFWVKNSTGTVLFLVTSTAQTYTNNYTVDATKNKAYTWGFNATVNGETFTKESGITFTGIGNLIDLNIDDKYYNWLSVIFLTGLALLFSYKTNRNGYIIVPAFAVFLTWITWLNLDMTISITTLVLGVLAYIRTAEKNSEMGI